MTLRSRLRRPGVRYIVVGGSVYVFELLVIFVALRMGASSLLAVGLSFWLGLMASFALQKFFTFGDKRMRRTILLSQIITVTALVLFNFGFTLLVTHVTSSFMPAFVSRTLALGVTTLWNFYLYKTRIFKVSIVD